MTSRETGNVHAAIDAVQQYTDSLQAALGAAVDKGDPEAATIIGSRYDDALLLESKLMALLTIHAAANAQAAVKAIEVNVMMLEQQKEQIDAVVKGVGTAADVLGEIAAIAAAFAKL